MVLGILAVALCGLFTGIPALVTGYGAKREIASSRGRQSGQGQATAGIVLGWVSVATTILLFLLLVVPFLGSSADQKFEDIGNEIDSECNNFDDNSYNDC